MDTATLRFYFDYLSPYAYLAWQEVKPLAARHGLAVEPVPVLLAALLNAHGHKGPAEIPRKRDYMFKECIRRAARLGVPLQAPRSHPFNPLLPLRATALQEDPAKREALMTALFDATWARSLDVSAPEVVTAVAEAVGIADVVARASDPALKAKFKESNAEAIELGIFGVPTLIVRDELFWGADSLVDVDAFLRGEDPLQDVDRGPWEAIEPSAARSIGRG